MKYQFLVLASSVALLAHPLIAGAVGQPAAGAVTPTTVKLPDGPGSVRGLAADATVSSFTGQVSYQIPIELPGGPGGLAPKLALSYSGALGNGPLGIGWSFGQVQVRRTLRLGVPSYTDSDELELVGLAGLTLVPIGNGQYRAEGQGNAIRGTAVTGGFELIDSAGTHYRLGTSDASRLESGSQVAAWYIEQVTDVAGHTINYTYTRQNNELYLSSITWGGSNVFQAELDYETRPDIVVCWRTGFRIADSQRLTAIKLWSFGSVRNTLQLTYDQSFALSRLSTATLVGSDGTALPTTTFTYAAPTVGQVQVLGSTGGWTLGSGTVSFFDVDNDGAMDLINIQSSRHSYRRNQGGSFGPETVINNAPALTMSSVKMMDLDGDSGAEMVSKSGSLWRSYKISNGAWVETDWPGASTLDPTTVAIADLNGDNRMDALAASGSGISVWFGTANGFAAPKTLPTISASEVTVTPTNVQFVDINGDGLADAISLGSSSMIQYRGKGDGTFERVGTVNYPWTGTTDTTQVRLADLDRDGLLDIVRIGTSQVLWYRGKPDGTFSTQATIVNRPAGADSSTVVQLADANGNGSTDIVWSSTSGMWALDLAGPTNAGLLTAIDNGMGKVQQFSYTASAQLAWNAEQAGSPWSVKMPVSIAVTTTATQALASGDPDRTSLLSVRDGIYEESERRFIGFAQSVQTFPGTAAADTIQVITQYHPGHGADRVLRGEVLSQSTQDGSGNVFELMENQVSALTVTMPAGAPSDPRLLRAAITQTQTTYTEPGDAPAVVRTRFAFDSEARVVEEDRDGSVTSGVALDGDESIIRKTYTSEDATTGVRDLVCEEDLLDGAGNTVSQAQRTFGDDTSAAASCQPGKGWVREELSYLASEARWVSQARTSYDVDGNPILTFANGIQRTLGYDANALHPVSESMSPADGETLTWTAQWDNVNGTLIKTVAPSGVEADVTYDGLGRLTSMAANGGLAYLYYRYNWTAPRPETETFEYDGDAAALAALPATWTPDSGWRHTVAVTNSAGEQLLTAVQLDAAQWNVGQYRQRDQRGRVIALANPFAYQGADVTVATPPPGAAIQTMSYDPRDRVTDQVLASGDHRRTTYHPLGATVAVDGTAPVTTVLDGQMRTTHTERTVNGVVESVDATYDAAGQILQFSLQGGQVTHNFTYDSLGRLISATDPDVGPRTMQYDDAGRLTSATNAAGDTVGYGYDGAGRLATVDGTGVTARYHYDTARVSGFGYTRGQLAWLEEPTGTVDFGYDALGRLITRQRTIVNGATTITGAETTQLTLTGLLHSLDLGDGVVLPIHYDAAGRAIQIDGVWSVTSYNAADTPVSEQFANGVTQQYERDILNRPSRITIGNPAGSLYNVTASYNAFGSIATLTDNDRIGLDHTASFGFDAGGRLTTASIGSGSAAYQFSYAYDGLQNMTHRTASGPTEPTELGILAGSYQYRTTSPRQLDHIASDDGTTLTSFAYDAAGRQVQHGAKRLSYDAMSHLVRVDGVAGGSVVHQYGYDGSRLSTTSAAGDTTYWITPNVVVRGSERDHYVHVGDRLIAKITTSSSTDGAAAGLLLRGRVGLAGFALLSIAALAALSGLTGLGKRLQRLRPIRAALAASLALLAVASGCGGNATLSSRATALTGATQLYFHQTYAAGPELTTDGSGQLQEERRSEPFGAAIDSFTGGAVQPTSYAANPINALNKFTDPDTTWSFHGARWLAPDVAQWNTPDPPVKAPDPKFMTSPWSLNPYQYVLQNPLSFWDPDGRDWMDWVAGACGAVAGFYDGLTGGMYSKVAFKNHNVQAWNTLAPSYHHTHVASEVTTSVALMATGVGELNGALRLGAAGLRFAYATEGVVMATRVVTVVNATDAALGASKVALAAVSLMSAAKKAGGAGTPGKVVYRYLSPEDRAALDAGGDLVPKGTGGTIAQHVEGTPTKYISAGETTEAITKYDSGFGCVAINVNAAIEGGAGFVAHPNVLQSVASEFGRGSIEFENASDALEVLFKGPIPNNACTLVK